MKSREKIRQKLEQFYSDVANKRKGKKNETGSRSRISASENKRFK